jgi:hypothetical protein
MGVRFRAGGPTNVESLIDHHDQPPKLAIASPA